MKILVVDTTSQNMVVAILSGGKIYSSVGAAESKRHNSQIILTVDRVLEEAKIKLNEIDYFACVAGPGSFTGIRIGVSTVKALAFACGKKCVSINALEELACDVADEEFYTAIDCGHESFYYAKFRKSFDNMIDIGEMRGEDLAKKSKVIYKDSPSRPETLIEIAKHKIEAEDFSELYPIYLKKSQAEREYDKKNMDKMEQV